MPKISKTLLFIFVLLFGVIVLKTFFFNRPDLKPETVVSSYLEKEQSGQRTEAEKFLTKDLKYVKILERTYEKIKRADFRTKDARREFKFKEEKNEQGYIKIIIVEKVLSETYFFDFLLSPEYQANGETEFEVYLAKEGNWWSGYQWKIAKIDSVTLIQYGKIGEEKEIKTKVFAVPLGIVNCQLPNQKCLRISIRSEAESQTLLSYSDWKIVDTSQKEYTSPSIKTFTVYGGGETTEEISFDLPQNFALKEALFKNEGKEIHFRN